MTQPLDVFTCPLGGIRLIEASAGTGKTWNICALYLRLLLERQLDVQQILVVTFTKAATAELRERIRSRIVQTLDELRAPGTAAAAGDPFVGNLLASLRGVHALDDEAMRLRLDAALQAFDEASIFTIHSFCQRALGDAPFTAGVPMKLEAMQDDSELVMEVAHDFWRRHVAAEATSPGLVAHLLSRKDTPERFAKLLKRQLAKPLSKAIWPPELDTGAAVDITALSKAHAEARAWWHQERGAIVGCVLEALPRLNGSSYKLATVNAAAADWDVAMASIDPLAAPTMLGKKYKAHLFSAEKLKPKKGMAPPQTHPFFALAEQVLDLRQAADTALDLDRLRLLRTLLTDGPTALRQLKRERRVIAFDDMLYNLHERLTSKDSPDLAATLKARFPAALIDEFQDTDPLQFAVFQTLYDDPTSPLFLVGDPKQAIYSFRNADLPTYLHARALAAEVYTLSENQRSTGPLLRGLNALFERNDRAFMLPGLAYQSVDYGAKKRHALIDATEPRAPLQLWSLPQDDAGEPWAKPQAMRCSMEACAGEIARLIGAAQQGRITLAGRPLAAGDIAVLVRSHAHGSEMRRALAELGVGSVELSQASVFASTDAEELARGLAAILEPTRERLLRAALATELLGRDAAAIEAISGNELELLALISRCTGHRELWLKRGVGVMLRRWMVDEQVSQRLLARPDGERRMTNLLHLCECLHEASQGASGHASPEALLRWLHQQRTQGRRDDATQLRLESDRNLVQIVTVHKAKGLEYPIVFCPALWDGRPAGFRSGLDGKEYHDDHDHPVVDFRPDFKKSVDTGGAIQQKLAIETAAETLRLIYVALTRAVHRCYLVVGSYTSKGTSVTEANHSLLNWLAAGRGQEPEVWLKAKLSSAEIAAAWSGLAADHAPDIAVSPLPTALGTPLAPQRPAPDTLAALPAPSRIPTAWWIGSYSSLAHGTQHEGAAVDHDLRAGETAPLPAAATFNAPDDDILRFPRGPVAGECMHTVFEHADFTDAQTWPAAIDAGLRLHPQSLRPGQINGDAATLLPAMLGRMLGDVLHTPLPAGFTLAQVPLRRRLVELEFSLPSRHLAAGDLAAAMREHGYPVPALEFGALEGYLRGFIDLVFEHDGRFYVLDWKSNHLGDGPDPYGQAHLSAAMTGNGYHLQYLLYTVAVHRYLQQRMAGYQYDRHFGGVLYLFVRGVRPDWRDAAGAATGVYAHKPSLDMVERLSALLEPLRQPA